VLRNEEDSSRIVHISQWQSLAKARGVLRLDSVGRDPTPGGVEAPEFIYLNQLDQGVVL
jgi:hypothetical protein